MTPAITPALVQRALMAVLNEHSSIDISYDLPECKVEECDVPTVAEWLCEAINYELNAEPASTRNLTPIEESPSYREALKDSGRDRNLL